MRIEGSKALVAGGSEGIGKAVGAEHLAGDVGAEADAVRIVDEFSVFATNPC